MPEPNIEMLGCSKFLSVSGVFVVVVSVALMDFDAASSVLHLPAFLVNDSTNIEYIFKTQRTKVSKKSPENIKNPSIVFCGNKNDKTLL